MKRIKYQGQRKNNRAGCVVKHRCRYVIRASGGINGRFENKMKNHFRATEEIRSANSVRRRCV